MELLKELFSLTTEEVDNVADTGTRDYVPLPKSSPKKKKGKSFPTSNRAENALINTIWNYQNADAV